LTELKDKVTLNELKKVFYLKVPLKLTQKVIKIISDINNRDKKNKESNKREQQNILRRNLKIIKEGEFNLIPINISTSSTTSSLISIAENIKKVKSEIINRLKEKSANYISEIEKIEIIEREMSKEDYKYKEIMDWKKSLKNVIKMKYPKEITELLPKTFDIIGDIAIIEFDLYGELSDFILKNFGNKYSVDEIKKDIGLTILKQNKNIKKVFNKGGKVDGEFRVRFYEHVVGDHSSLTKHKENNCIFELDIKKVFFNPRLVYERNRISNKPFKNNAVILDCFAGVGPFSIEIACKHLVKIIASEKNPYACEFFRRNIILNKKKMKGQVELYCGDFRELSKSEIGKKYLNCVDCIIMNLPKKNLEFIKFIRPFIKNNGSELIIYLLEEEPNPIEKGIEELNNHLIESKIHLEKINFSRIVKNYSPKIYMIVLEAMISIPSKI